MKNIRILLILANALILCVGCRGEFEGTGPGKRPQVLALQPSDELEIGREAFQEALNGADLVTEGREIEAVQRVSERIAAALEIEPLQREINLHVKGYKFEWQYAVVRDRRVNAFCLPGGKMVVFSGLLQFVTNEDQLATVIAHEIAHAVAHHTSERLARMQSTKNPLVNLAFNRDQESEADHIGVFLMTFAGYDPDQAVDFWRQMLVTQGSRFSLPEFLSDHPNHEHRMKNMETWAANAKAGKAAFDSGRVVAP